MGKFLLFFLLVGLTLAIDSRLQTQPRADLDQVFLPQQSGWLGADSSASIRLDATNYLWLWGDTLVGHSQFRLRDSGWRMPHQTLAIMSSDHVPHYVIPSGNALAPCGASCFFWFVGGVVGAQTGALFVQTWNISASEWSGNVITVVEKPDPESIHHWQYKHVSLPIASGCSLTCGVANGDGGMLLLLGNCHHHAILARVKETDLILESSSSLQFWYSDGWTKDMAKAQPLFESQAFSESSLHKYPELDLWVAPVLQNGHSTIQLATAPTVTGPWSVSAVFDIPAQWGEAQNRSAYAAKAHPELGDKTSIVISFNTNTRAGPPGDPWRERDANHGLRNTSVYRPRFLEVRMPPAPDVVVVNG